MTVVFVTLMGVLPYIQSNMAMISVAMILRAGQGFFRVFVIVPMISIINITQPKDRMKYIGYSESAMQIGIGIGPIIGSILYGLVGFSLTFVIIGIYHIFYIPVLMTVMPADIDSNSEETIGLTENKDIIEEDVNSEVSTKEIVIMSRPMLLL